MDIEKVAERAALEMVENGIIGHASHVMAATRAVLAIALRAAAEVAKGPYPSTSKYDDRSALYGSDLNPDRSEFGRGKQAGREAASAALRTLATQLGAANGGR